MSTKCTILSNADSSIYAIEETNEPTNDIFGDFTGFNKYLWLEDGHYEFTIASGFMELRFINAGVFDIGSIESEITVDLRDIFEISYDHCDGLCLSIHGWSKIFNK